MKYWILVTIIILFTACSNAADKASETDKTPPNSQAGPGGNNTFFKGVLEVNLSCEDVGVGCKAIYYTLDRSEPSKNSIEYDNPIIITKTTTLKYFAIDQLNNPEPAHTAEYTLDETPPKTTPSTLTGDYPYSLSITLECNDGEGIGCDKIYYTLNGLPPSIDSTEYTSPIEIGEATTLRYFAMDLLGTEEGRDFQEYTFSKPLHSINIKSFRVEQIKNVELQLFTDQSGTEPLETLPLIISGDSSFKKQLGEGENFRIEITSPQCSVDNDSGVISSILILEVICYGTPIDVIAKSLNQQVIISWSDMEADQYNIYISTKADFDPDLEVPIAVVTTATNYEFKKLTNEILYYIAVKAIFGQHDIQSMVGARPNSIVFNKKVNAITVDSSGNSYIGGEFTQVGAYTGGAVPISMQTTFSMENFPEIYGKVYAIAPDPKGGWFIGGEFTQVGGITIRNLARVSTNKQLDETWKPNPNGIVRALITSGNTLYVGGQFTIASSELRNYIAAFNGQGNLLSWNPNFQKNVGVYALATTNSTLYVSGRFIIGTQDVGIAKFDAKGNLSWNINADGSVYAIAISGTTLYAGGIFTSIGTESKGKLAAFNTEDNSLLPWNPNPNSTVNSLAIKGTTLYAGGDFALIGTESRGKLAAFNTEDNSLLPWNPNLNAEVNALTISGTTLYAGGKFTKIGAESRGKLAAFNTEDNSLLPWNLSPDGSINALAVSGSTLYAGGEFTSIDTEQRGKLAALDPQGNLLPWNPNVNGISVDALKISGTTLYVGGFFTNIGTEPRDHMAAFNTKDSTLLPWNPNVDLGVYTFLVSGTTLYVGGNFRTIDTKQRGFLAAFDLQGNLLPWNPGLNGPVNALAASETTLYVGGSFSNAISGETRVPRGMVAAFSTQDNLLLPWNPKIQGIHVRALATNGTTLYVGGWFTKIGIESRSNLAAFSNQDNSLISWNPNLSSEVNALTISGTTLYAGGKFTKIGTESRGKLAAFNTEDNSLLPWNPNADGVINALATSGITLYAGGSFTAIGTDSRGRLASFDDQENLLP